MNPLSAFIVVLITFTIISACSKTPRDPPSTVVPDPSPPVASTRLPTLVPATSSVPLIQTQYTERQIQHWNRDITKTGLLSLPEITTWGIKKRPNRIEVGVACESNRDEIRQRVPRILSGSEIPPEVIQIIVHPRVRFPEDPELFQCAPLEVVDPLTGKSSPGFGGLFFIQDRRSIDVYMLEPNEEKAEELALEVLGRETLERYPNVRVIQGQYTWEQLVEWWYRIIDDPTIIQGASFSPGAFHADPYRNRLVVEVRRERNPDVETDVRDFLDRIGVPRGAVVFLGHDEPLR